MFLKLGLKTRIYLSMITIILLSFLATGFASFYQFKKQNETYHTERLKRKESAILNTINYLINEELFLTHTDSFAVFFDKKIHQIADINNLDLNIYSLQGNLLVSSNPLLFDNNLLSEPINPSTLNKLKKINDKIVVKKNNLLLTYSMINNIDGNAIALLELPYFQSSFSDKKELNQFLVTLAQVYLALFFGASLLAFLLSKYITNSLKLIVEKLKSVGIKEKVPLLSWDSDDEIGSIINQYNIMVKELEKSAEKLAKSERESAWKKMAKQIAHEIKNTLTPMKLSVQHLQKSLTQNDANFKEKIDLFVTTLTNQIDTLSSIATAFSNFANMPGANKKDIDLVPIMNSAMSLFSNYNIVLINNYSSLFINADKEQLIRIFNNLINNAFEASKKDEGLKISIKLNKVEENIVISIRDNGVGIEKKDLNLIFEPNFTTKTSGTGLGLAMVKNIIESSNGKIWVKSSLGKGTTFYLSFPLIKLN